MDWGSPFFVLVIIAISTAGWLINNWIRARHGYPVENEWSGVSHKAAGPDEQRQLSLLSDENESLKAKLLRLEERLSNLERIATDPTERTAREIDALRHS